MLVNTDGPQAVTDAVNGTIGECQDIADLNDMLTAYDAQVQAYADEGDKLRKDQPKHQLVQGVGTGISGGLFNPAYMAGNGVSTIFQWGNQHWTARMDKHFINGTDVQISGTRVFLASERIYQREMSKYCPALKSYLDKYGSTLFDSTNSPAAQGTRDWSYTPGAQGTS